MKNIVKADMYHLLRSRVFYITVGIGILICTMMNLSGSTLVIMGGEEFPPIIDMSGGAYSIYFSIGTAKNIMLFLLPIYMCILNKDFSEKIILNILARKIKKITYFVAKVVSTCIVSVLVYAIIYFIPMFVVAEVRVWGLQEPFIIYFRRLIITVLCQMIVACVMGSLAFYLNLLIQKASVFVTIYICAIFVSGNLYLISQNTENFFLHSEIYLEHWMLASVNNQLFSGGDYLTMMLVLSIWFLIPGIISYQIFMSRDIV